MATNSKRYRLSVPEEDAAVAEWLENQLNYSLSIRLLIRQDIMKNGTSDVTCRDVQQVAKKVKPQKQQVANAVEQTLSERSLYQAPVHQPLAERTSMPVQTTFTVDTTVDDDGGSSSGLLASILG